MLHTAKILHLSIASVKWTSYTYIQQLQIPANKTHIKQY